jgi:hypothetical protein
MRDWSTTAASTTVNVGGIHSRRPGAAAALRVLVAGRGARASRTLAARGAVVTAQDVPARVPFRLADIARGQRAVIELVALIPIALARGHLGLDVVSFPQAMISRRSSPRRSPAR